jgi:putative hydrolase of the HAD superfamily
VDLYFFDLDKTLYAYDFRRRLPELARLSGVSQYQLAHRWWSAGLERKAEAGALATAAEYLDEFARVTGGRRLELEEWASARRLAMTRIERTVASLERCRELGTVSLLSNNPSALFEALPQLAPDVVAILGGNTLVSFMLGARKPDAVLFERALVHYGVEASNAFLVDDNLGNVEGARAVGITAHHFDRAGESSRADALDAAIDRFAGRNG